jgi:hypothetical protein
MFMRDTVPGREGKPSEPKRFYPITSTILTVSQTLLKHGLVMLKQEAHSAVDGQMDPILALTGHTLVESMSFPHHFNEMTWNHCGIDVEFTSVPNG